jgi:hypothetical protein
LAAPGLQGPAANCGSLDHLGAPLRLAKVIEMGHPVAENDLCPASGPYARQKLDTMPPGSVFVYCTGWLANAKRAIEGLREVASAAWDMSRDGRVCLTQRVVTPATEKTDPVKAD